MKERNASIDSLKGFACILVICNHLESYVNELYIVSHLGVPIFFLISGYYLYKEDAERLKTVLPHKIKHIFKLFILHNVLYLFDYFFKIIVLDGNITSKENVLVYLKAVYSKKEILKTIIYQTSFLGMGQWFLTSLLLAYIFFYIVCKLKLYHWICNNLCMIFSVLFVIHLVIRPLLFRYTNFDLWEIGLGDSEVVRNLWFDTIPFLLMGMRIHQKDINSHNKHLAALTIIGITLSICEAFFINIYTNNNLRCVCYMGTIIASFSLVVYAINNPVIRSGFLKKGGLLHYIGSELSTIVFFIHPIVIYYVSKYIISNISNKFVLKIMCVVIIILSLLIAHMCRQILKSINRFNYAEKAWENRYTWITILLLFAFSLLPTTSEWKLICSVSALERGAKRVEFSDDISMYTELLFTLQKDNGETWKSVIVPVAQYQGGAIVLSESNCTINYVTKTESDVICESNVRKNVQLRVWGR